MNLRDRQTVRQCTLHRHASYTAQNRLYCNRHSAVRTVFPKLIYEVRTRAVSFFLKCFCFPFVFVFLHKQKETSKKNVYPVKGDRFFFFEERCVSVCDQKTK
uniref:Uncharacterized protein n=1 Tax=Anguilla anguilla TaxID=7936 RepID=A0A0E9X067_ANGAN